MQNENGHELLTLAEASKLLPTSNGRRINTSTLWRWCTTGVRGVRLRHYRFGRRVSVTLPDLLAFGQEVAEGHATRRA